MCILAIQYKLVNETPILVAANREEAYDRPSAPPSIQSGKPRVLCGLDKLQGGTWLGVNQNGLCVGVCNRHRFHPPTEPKSRGVLCKELLRASSARRAVDMCLDEVSTGNYNGGNFVIADYESAWCVHATDDYEVVRLPHGLSIVARGDVGSPGTELEFAL